MSWRFAAALSLGGLLLQGCASASRGVLPEFDRKEFRNRPIVVLLARGVHPITGLAQGPYRSFGRDGISDVEFQRRLQVAFFERLAISGVSAGIAVDSVTPFHPMDDSASFPLGSRAVKAYFADADVDSSKLQLILGPIVFSTEQLGMPGVGGGLGTSSTRLYANMSWLIYDPQFRKAVAAGRLETSSTTFAVITNIITQSNWFTDARQLAEALSQAIEGLR